MNEKTTLQTLLTPTLALIAFVFFTGMDIQSASAEVQTHLSSQEAYVGTPVTLYIQVAGANSTNSPQLPDVDGLEIRSTGAPSRSSRVTIVNGRRSEFTSATYSYLVIPRREGTFEIPSIEVKTQSGTEQTRPVRFSATRSETGDLMFAEIVGDGEKVFVGQPIKTTLKIWIKPFTDRQAGIKLSPDQMWQLMSEQSEWGGFRSKFEELASNGQRIHGHEVLRKDNEDVTRSYYLYEIEATIYPKAAGKMIGQEVQIVYQYPIAIGKSRDPFDSFFDNSPLGGSSLASQFFGDRSPFGRSLAITNARPIVVEPKVSDIEIAAIPNQGQPADYQGAVGQYAIATQASPTHVKAGDPITLQIGIRGTGPMELVQAPPLHKLPSLTVDFKVADEALAGVVQGDVKVFVTTIRPRNENVSQVPAIPISFFDPNTEKFVTVHSAPLQIEVDIAETLAMDSIVGNSGIGSTEQDEAATATSPVLNLDNVTNESILSSNSPIDLIANRWWLLLTPPLIFLSVVAWRWRIKRSNSTLALANQSVRTAVSPSALANTVQQTINAICKQPTSLQRHIPNDIPGDLANEIRGLYVSCDQFTYSRIDRHSMEKLKDRALGILRQLPTHRKSWYRLPKLQRPAQTIGFAATFAAVLMLVGFTFVETQTKPLKSGSLIGENDRPTRIELDTSQRIAILAEADNAYSKGQSLIANDAAEAKVAFDKAAEKYQLLVDSGVHNSYLSMNLGNAYLQNNRLGLAIASYHRSINLNPFNQQAVNNLEIAKSRVGHSKREIATLPYWSASGVFSFINRSVSHWVPWALFGVAWIAMWALAALQISAIWPLGKLNNRIAIASVVVTALACSWLAADSRLQPKDERPIAVVISDEATVLSGCDDEFKAIPDLATVEGQEFRVVQLRGGWCQVESDSGQQGWVKTTFIKIV